jgi:hypothetical protein
MFPLAPSSSKLSPREFFSTALRTRFYDFFLHFFSSRNMWTKVYAFSRSC